MLEDFEVLEKASGLLFSLGAFISKLQYVPITMIRLSSNIFALFMYLLGYFLWIAACQTYPNEKPKKQYWYTFVEFKKQFLASAIIGSVAMAFSLLALVNPAAFVISAWLMAVSNFLWIIGERNKIENPPKYRQLPNVKLQKTYFNYATIVFSISVITAMSVTGVVFFPPAAVYIVSLATILTTGLTLWSAEHILEIWFPTPINKATLSNDNIPIVSPSLTRIQACDQNRNSDNHRKHEIKQVKPMQSITPPPSPLNPGATIIPCIFL